MTRNCTQKRTSLCDAEWRQSCWLIGTFVQHLLIRIEGKKMKTMDELRKEDPGLSIADSINLHRDLYGPRMEWDVRRVHIRYLDEEFEITDDAEKIAEKWIDDKEGFRIACAFNEAVDVIVAKIAGEKEAQRFKNLSAMEIIALG